MPTRCARCSTPARRFTAIVAGNDLIALGCYDVFAERGIDCPRDVSVVGFNDMPFLDKLGPPLTTIAIPHQQIGAEAARLLLDAHRRAEPAGEIGAAATFAGGPGINGSTSTMSAWHRSRFWPVAAGIDTGSVDQGPCPPVTATQQLSAFPSRLGMRPTRVQWSVAQ